MRLFDRIEKAAWPFVIALALVVIVFQVGIAVGWIPKGSGGHLSVTVDWE